MIYSDFLTLYFSYYTGMVEIVFLRDIVVVVTLLYLMHVL
jgi:hypothetical protein